MCETISYSIFHSTAPLGLCLTQEGKQRLDPTLYPKLNPQEAAGQLWTAMIQIMTRATISSFAGCKLKTQVHDVTLLSKLHFFSENRGNVYSASAPFDICDWQAIAGQV